MSLYHVLTNSFTLWPDAYECPEEMKTTKFEQPVLGTVFLSSGVIFLTLYIPCVLAIIKKIRHAPVYQIMFGLSIFDIFSLCVTTFGTGLFDIFGISFCHYPVLIFCIGGVAGGCWIAGCFSCVLLAIERCAEINQNFPLGFLFRKNVFPILRGFFVCFTFYAVFFTKATVFTAEYSCWFFDPIIGKDPELYHSIVHTVNNIVVSTTTILLYLYISYRLIFKFGYSTSMWLYKTKRQILFQALSLCSFHTATGLYIYMQFSPPSPVLIIASQFLWQFSSGAVCVSYLVFNRTIRNIVLKMVIPKSVRIKYGLHIGVEEHIAMEEAVASVPVAVPGINAIGGVIKFDNYLY